MNDVEILQMLVGGLVLTVVFLHLRVAELRRHLDMLTYEPPADTKWVSVDVTQNPTSPPNG